MGHLTNLCHEAVKKYWSLGSLWENLKEAEWLLSLEEGRTEMLSKFSEVQRGGNLLSYF